MATLRHGYHELMEELIEDSGGCGRFQFVHFLLVESTRAIASWTMFGMAFMGQTPAFRCSKGINDTMYSGYDVTSNSSQMTCETGFGVNESCNDHLFDPEFNTIVTEWDLVCDEKWVAAMVTTVQMAGVLIGCFISGHLGDFIGRKPTFYVSQLLLVLFNIIAYFSVNVHMYAAVRFVLGMGCGFHLTVSYSYLIEFMPDRWRARSILIPVWASTSSVFGLACWATKDWRNLHLLTAAVGLPLFCGYWTSEESIRWLITRERYDDAEKSVEKIARFNRREKPDISIIMKKAADAIQSQEKASKTYTMLDLFRTSQYRTRTIGLLCIWFTCSYSYYGLTFGVGKLSGNFYINIFLMSIIETPSAVIVLFCINKIGRKYTCMIFFTLAGACGILNGIFKYVDVADPGTLTVAFALSAKLTVSCGWSSLMIYSTELYPTVIRTTAYGMCNTVARIGGMLAPQIVMLADSNIGVLYFPSGILMIISAVICLVFPDTKDCLLEDTMRIDSKKDKAETCHNGASTTHC